MSKKLILAFLGLTLVVLLATLSLARWSFERGFLEYTNNLERQRLELLATNLSKLYDGNDWSSIERAKLHHFLQLHPYSLLGQVINDDGEIQLNRRPGAKGKPPRPPRAGAKPKPRPPHKPKPPLDAESNRQGQPQFIDDQRVPPTALLNREQKFVAGKLPRVDNEQWVRINILVDDQVVGTLVTASKRRFDSPEETAFSKQQWITSGIIAAIALLLALAVSLLLTRIFLAPIKRMLQRISTMSNGDYQTQLNENRRDELGLLMNDLDRLAMQLQQNQSARQRWIADISHELRTPITVLSGEISAIKDGVRPLDMQQVDSLGQEVERLQNLIEDLYQLSLSDVGGLRYNFNNINIIDDLDYCIEKVSNKAKQHGLVISANLPEVVMVSGDSARLQQLFGNLLNNALAYTDAPGEIAISVNVDHELTIFIEDSSPGVDVKECNKLLEPLYRNEMSRNRRQGGAGLGLAICRNIVLAHQGSISINPSELGGICVMIKLPLL
nr:ATP-binding protein [Shewanella sp. WXL01]